MFALALLVVFALVWFFLTSSSLVAMRMAGAYPFAVILFGLGFLYLFVISGSDWQKWLSGIMFLVCGFACMQDVEKIRRGHKEESASEE